jgi:predicted membrane protein
MDQNSSGKIHQSPDRKIVGGTVIGSNVAVYHPVQLSGSGNRTITINLSPFLRDTLDLLGLSGGRDPPVISYVYLNVEGYNFRWNTTLYSFYLMSDTGTTQASTLVNQQLPFMVSLIATVAVVILTVHSLMLRERSRAIS